MPSTKTQNTQISALKLPDASDDVSRRGFITTLITSAGTVVASTAASAASTQKVLVLGGTGMVGSQIVKQLQSMEGIDVVATSRDGRDGTLPLDFSTSLDVSVEVEKLAKGCTAVISTVGVIGTPLDKKVNSGSGLAAEAAKKAGVERFVYISVAPEVRKFGQGIDLFKEYMIGKQSSEDAIVSNFGNDSKNSYTLIEPTFIYGGDKFGINPPRVASGYGSIIESILASGPLRAATNIAPEGVIKIALEPPISADAVAKAAIASALRKTDSVLDTYDKIQQAAKTI